MNGILAGVTVALKQSVPDKEINVLMMSVKVKVRENMTVPLKLINTK